MLDIDNNGIINNSKGDKTVNTVGELIKQIRLSKGLSQRKLAQLAGLSETYIQSLEKNRRTGITTQSASKIANALGVKANVFLSNDPPPLRSPGDVLSELERGIRSFMPVYAEVSAGGGMAPIDYVAVTSSEPAPVTMRAYRVRGLCLEPEIKDGDTVTIDTALSPIDGDLVICIIDGDVSIKRLVDKGDGSAYLENNHGHYRPESVYIHGVVLDVVHKIRRR